MPISFVGSITFRASPRRTSASGARPRPSQTHLCIRQLVGCPEELTVVCPERRNRNAGGHPEAVLSAAETSVARTGRGSEGQRARPTAGTAGVAGPPQLG